MLFVKRVNVRCLATSISTIKWNESPQSRNEQTTVSNYSISMLKNKLYGIMSRWMSEINDLIILIICIISCCMGNSLALEFNCWNHQSIQKSVNFVCTNSMKLRETNRFKSTGIAEWQSESIPQIRKLHFLETFTAHFWTPITTAPTLST